MERGSDANGCFQGTPLRSVQSLGDHTELSTSRNVSDLHCLIGIDSSYIVADQISTEIFTSFTIRERTV